MRKYDDDDGHIDDKDDAGRGVVNISLTLNIYALIHLPKE